MRVFGMELSWSKKSTLTLDQLVQRLELAYQTVAGITVTPETALESPTVQAIIRAIGGHLSALPVHVLLKSTSAGRARKEPLPNHPVQRLLNAPSQTQDRVSYWLDATSWLLRYGNHYAFKARGVTGPIRRLEPLPPAAVTVEQADDLTLLYRVQRHRGDTRTYTAREIHHARRMSRDGVVGDSPVVNARLSIALEIAAERYGAAFFGNGAMPALVFQYMTGSGGHRTEEERKQFIDDFQAAFTGRGRFRAMLLPKGIEMAEKPIEPNNEQAQFLETRKYQRTVIAGAFGVPPQFVGDLERATFNNAEQQSIDFVQNVVLPDARLFEAAMERDLLTDEDRAGGVIIRFNLDAALRGDFRTRQEGLKMQREAGVINPNEWREQEGLNPRADAGGEAYWDQGPSGQGRRAGAARGEDDPADDPAAPALNGRNGRAR
jgi:HK97 family phage portal protein